MSSERSAFQSDRQMPAHSGDADRLCQAVPDTGHIRLYTAKSHGAVIAAALM